MERKLADDRNIKQQARRGKQAINKKRKNNEDRKGN